MDEYKRDVTINMLSVQVIFQVAATDENFDVNMHLVCLNKQGEVCNIVNYSRNSSAITYGCDKMTEGFTLDLSKFDEIQEVYFVVQILNGLKRSQSLAMLSSISFFIPECNVEEKFDNLSEWKEETSLLIGRLYKTGSKWKFRITPEVYAANAAYQIFM